MTQELRLIRIDHSRCGEPVAHTFILAPADWDAKTIDQGIQNAYKAYWDAIQIAQNKEKEPPTGNPTVAKYKEYPDKTVAEVEAIFAEQFATHSAWQKDQWKARQEFQTFLKGEGFTLLWDDEAKIPRFDVNWGHRHGISINYSATDVDTMPLPIQVIDPDFEEDW
jgi:hypothetical protein